MSEDRGVISALGIVVNSALRDALEEMVWQFASRTVVDGKRALSTMGLSALEIAFSTLGWDDPYFIHQDECGCQWQACIQWATCGTPTPAGYRRFCGEHYVQYRKDVSP